MLDRFCAMTCTLTAAVFLLAPPMHAQNASIGGTVMIDPTEKPLANAEIILTALKRSTRSDSAGNFVFTGLPAGRHVMVVRLVGYEPTNSEISVSGSQKFEADFLLKPVTTKLAAVDVKAKTENSGRWAIRLQEFEERRSMGIGKFMTEADFADEGGRSVGAIMIKKIAGMKVVQQNGRQWLASLRATKMFSCKPGACGSTMEQVPPGCYMQIIVNGIIRYNGSAGQSMYDLNELNASDIIGLEFYTTATTPLQYNATRGSNMGACGTVIFWTKNGG